MPRRFEDCIFCGGKNGSAEHLVLAALGGLRTDRGVLCDTCNGSFNELDSALASDMRALNAMIGVRHGRTKIALRTEVKDPETGRTYLLSEARQLRHPEPVVLEDRVVDGVRNIYAVASTEAQAEEFVRRIRAEGKPVTFKRERVPLLFAAPPQIEFAFGGPVTFRAVARAVLNLFAHHHPAKAREHWLDPLKRFIRDGHGDLVSFAYDDAESTAAPDSFAFQHRFVIVMDAATGAVYAHVSLLGVVELEVRLGQTTLVASETLVHDVDVTAAAAPDDVKVQHFAGTAMYLPRPPTLNPAVYWHRRLATLARKRADALWQQDAPALVHRLNAARELPATERHRHLVAALQSQRQRLLNLAAYVRGALRQHLNDEVGAEAAEVADALGVFVESDGKSKTGVTDLTRVHTDMLCYVMADALVSLLADHPLDEVELRSMLEGHQGAAVIGTYMVGELQRTHPAFRED